MTACCLQTVLDKSPEGRDNEITGVGVVSGTESTSNNNF